MDALAISSRPPLLAAKGLLERVALPCSDLSEQHLEHFFYCGPADGPTGLVGLEIYGPHALLRSLAVAASARSSGLGSALLSRAEAHARERDVHEIYLLTTAAQAFFEARGYRITPRESCPAAIRATREFANLCPANSALLKKPLSTL